MREFLKELKSQGMLIEVNKKVSTGMIPALLKKLDGHPVIFTQVEGSSYRVVGNICSSRDLLALSLNVRKEELIFKLAEVFEKRSHPEVIKNGRCQEITESVNLNSLPILTHTEGDGGPYVTSGVLIIRDPEFGRNASFHRLMLLDDKRFATRIVEDRDTDVYLKRAGGEMEVAISIGNHPSLLLAASTSLDITVDELEIANSLRYLKLVKCKKVDLEVPADCEIVLEGRITSELVDEGPFLDLTDTYDIVRKQPVIEIKHFSHAKNPIYQALLPGGLDHRLLMGLPKEPVIFNEVNKVCECKNVLITPGGCSWLHGLVQIHKRSQEDGKNAIEAAFRAHKSMKHVVILDEDTDIYDLNSVEYAIATRFQASKNMVLKKDRGSSLDPSANQVTRETTKVGIDATIPFDKDKSHFLPVKILGEAKVRVEDYVSQ
ncbi:MAG: UbiD family decarboxylase [Candidatus Jordarchaeum sp.]|uniref:UbiD family decarboxylase n=1 Tax=Candidatus Jordarchaeum sp. TaxID=2823881 RepID=UPI00404B1AF0